MEYRITVPEPSTYALRAEAGKCLATTTAGSPPPSGAAARSLNEGEVNCMGSVGGLAANLLPGGPCVSLVTVWLWMLQPMPPAGRIS